VGPGPVCLECGGAGVAQLRAMSAPGTVSMIRPRHGEAVRLSPLVRRIVADNPGPFTYTGSGSYIVGRGTVAVIDPGPADERHIEALIRATAGERIARILVTHTHSDHSGGAAMLAAETGAPTAGFGPHGAAADERAEPGGPVEEGADRDFVPDCSLADGERIAGPGWTLAAVHTPGHTANHLCFALPQENALFTGDHVMGWSTTVIAPPDGDMSAYLDSLARVRDRGDAVLWPTHGPPIPHPRGYVEGLIAHRLAREAAILGCLDRTACRIPEIVNALYADVPRELHPAAARSVHAHLIRLVTQGRAICDGPPSLDSVYLLRL